MTPGCTYVVHNTYPTLVRRYHVHTYLVHPTLNPTHFLLRCRLLLPYRFFSTLKPRLVEHTADVYCRTDFYCGTDGTFFGGGMYQLETRFARIIRYEYSLYVLQSRASRSRCSIPGISGLGRHAHKPGTSSASCCFNGSVG